MTQILLFPDPRPLVERLGREFFRQLPERPGVYLMKDATDTALYVGKAKNLRKRLGSYRVANPDRMPRRHLRLLRAVERIEIQECADECAALQREAQLLRTLRPRFNRAGTWTAPPKLLAWKLSESALHIAVTAAPEAGWRTHGAPGARHLRAALARLLWFALRPSQGSAQMPAGWFRGHYGDIVTLKFSPASHGEVSTQLDALFAGNAGTFAGWILSKVSSELALFEKTVLEADLESVTTSVSAVDTQSL